MLVIVFGCERFHDYLYGQREITVESDHKPLEAILKKPIHQAPLRLQRMFLRIKPYAVNVKYLPGSQLILADTLSRAYLPSKAADQPDEYEIYVLDSGQLSETMFYKLRDETKSDFELQQLQKVVMSGWPQTQVETPVETRPYWNYRDEISCYEGLMLKGDRIIVPHRLRPEILQRIHAAHLGIEKCKARARGAVFWPGINSAIDELVSKCSTCQQHQRSNQREPLIPQEVPKRPWATVAADIFYYKVARLSSKNSEAVILAMKDMFARHGIPERLIADNMLFNSISISHFISNFGGAFVIWCQSIHATIEHSTFLYNSFTFALAILLDRESIFLKNVTMESNTAGLHEIGGAAVIEHNCTLKIHQSRFVKNTASSWGAVFHR